MKESNIMKGIMLAIGRIPGLKTFRNNTGIGWQGTVLSNTNGKLIMTDARPLRAGLIKGSPDLVGWKSVEVTPDMVGKRVAVFVGLEVKGERTRTTEEQLNFLKTLQRDGGIAGVARCPEDALNIIGNQ